MCSFVSITQISHKNGRFPVSESKKEDLYNDVLKPRGKIVEV